MSSGTGPSASSSTKKPSPIRMKERVLQSLRSTSTPSDAPPETSPSSAASAPPPAPPSSSASSSTSTALAAASTSAAKQTASPPSTAASTQWQFAQSHPRQSNFIIINMEMSTDGKVKPAQKPAKTRADRKDKEAIDPDKHVAPDATAASTASGATDDGGTSRLDSDTKPPALSSKPAPTAAPASAFAEEHPQSTRKHTAPILFHQYSPFEPKGRARQSLSAAASAQAPLSSSSPASTARKPAESPKQRARSESIGHPPPSEPSEKREAERDADRDADRDAGSRESAKAKSKLKVSPGSAVRLQSVPQGGDTDDETKAEQGRVTRSRRSAAQKREPPVLVTSSRKEKEPASARKRRRSNSESFSDETDAGAKETAKELPAAEDSSEEQGQEEEPRHIAKKIALAGDESEEQALESRDGTHSTKEKAPMAVVSEESASSPPSDSPMDADVSVSPAAPMIAATEPAEPAEPAEPVEPAEPAEPADSAEPIAPTDLAADAEAEAAVPKVATKSGDDADSDEEIEVADEDDLPRSSSKQASKLERSEAQQQMVAMEDIEEGAARNDETAQAAPAPMDASSTGLETDHGQEEDESASQPMVQDQPQRPNAAAVDESRYSENDSDFDDDDDDIDDYASSSDDEKKELEEVAWNALKTAAANAGITDIDASVVEVATAAVVAASSDFSSELKQEDAVAATAAIVAAKVASNAIATSGSSDRAALHHFQTHQPAYQFSHYAAAESQSPAHGSAATSHKNADAMIAVASSAQTSEPEDALASSSAPAPVQATVIDRTRIQDAEIQANREFFLGRKGKTPERYTHIRNYILSMWEKRKPHHVSQTAVRPGLKNCGDVNAIGRVHSFLEQIGAINVNAIEAPHGKGKSAEATARSHEAQHGTRSAGHGNENNSESSDTPTASSLETAAADASARALKKTAAAAAAARRRRERALAASVLSDGTASESDEQPIIVTGTRRRRVRNEKGEWVDEREKEGRTIDEEAKRREAILKQQQLILTQQQAALRRPRHLSNSLNFDGDEMWLSLDHDNNHDNHSLQSHDPFHLVPCRHYASSTTFSSSLFGSIRMGSESSASGASSGKAAPPFRVRIESNPLLVIDVHAHIAHTEVIGLLGGHFDADSDTLSVVSVYPCNSQSSGIQCEMDPSSELEAREHFAAHGLSVVGWYHSHPQFAPDPSRRDIETQTNYQRLFAVESGKEPFIGIIISPYDLRSKVDVSTLNFITISNEWDSKHEYRLPYVCDYMIVPSSGSPLEALSQLASLIDHYKDYKDRVDMFRPYKGLENKTCLDKLLASLSSRLTSLVADSDRQLFLNQTRVMFGKAYLALHAALLGALSTEQLTAEALLRGTELLTSTSAATSAAFRNGASASSSRDAKDNGRATTTPAGARGDFGNGEDGEGGEDGEDDGSGADMDDLEVKDEDLDDEDFLEDDEDDEDDEDIALESSNNNNSNNSNSNSNSKSDSSTNFQMAESTGHDDEFAELEGLNGMVKMSDIDGDSGHPAVE